MKTTKILSVLAGVSLLAASLMPVKVSAASAPMTLSGATQNNGSFSTMVYETSDGSVSSVKLALNFSTPVTDVSYDYSAGVFTATDPDGYHLSIGAVTGKQPVARVSFRLASPGSVTASIASSSVVKGPNATNDGVVYYSVGNAGATFTYNAPANSGGSTPAPTPAAPAPTASTPTKKTTSTTGTAANSGEVAAAETQVETTAAPADETKKDEEDTKKSDAKKTDDKKTSSSAWFWPMAIIAIAAGYIAARAIQKRNAAASAENNSAKSEKSAPAKKAARKK